MSKSNIWICIQILNCCVQYSIVMSAPRKLFYNKTLLLYIHYTVTYQNRSHSWGDYLFSKDIYHNTIEMLSWFQYKITYKKTKCLYILIWFCKQAFLYNLVPFSLIGFWIESFSKGGNKTILKLSLKIRVELFLWPSNKLFHSTSCLPECWRGCWLTGTCASRWAWPAVAPCRTLVWFGSDPPSSSSADPSHPNRNHR